MSRKDIEILHKRQLESEDRLERSWMPKKGERVLRGGNIHYEISDRVRAIDCGGLGVVQLLVEHLGTAQSIEAGVRVLERQLVLLPSSTHYFPTDPEVDTKTAGAIARFLQGTPGGAERSPS